MLPHQQATPPEIVFLNTSGGLTSGDRLDYGVTIGPGCHATATTQTAERAYRADGPPARASVHLKLAQGASLDWLPQETILFDNAALHRETRVELADSTRFLGIETIVLGRVAMGETINRLNFRDRRLILRQNQPMLIDPFRLDDAALDHTNSTALLAGARAFATLILVDDDTEGAVRAIRAELTETDVTGAASACQGRMVVRCQATDAWPLRRQMIRLIRRLRPGPLPRVWQL